MKSHQKSWKAAIKLIMVVVSIILLITACGKPSATDDTAKSSTASLAEPAETTPEITPTPSPSATPVSVEDEIINDVKKEFGEENYISVDYNSTNNFVLIKAKGKELFTSKSTVKGMYLNMANTLESLSDLPDIDIAFNIVYPLQDKYGNSTDTIVIKATYTHDTRAKINWDKFLFDSMPSIADDWWMHDALLNALG